MKFTFSWLKDHLDTEATLDEVCEALSMLGLEVEGVEDRASDFAPFVAARVLAAEPHPRADRLRVCLVDTGREEVQVVCGAPNARAGMMGVFAPSGSWIPGSALRLKKAAIRGVESNGMLLSERELGVSDEHEGIVELPDNAPLGAPYARIAGLDDPVIEIGLTPNRSDCAGIRGIARDLAARGLGRLKGVPGWGEAVPGAFDSPVQVRLELGGAADACPLFAGRYIRGIRNGPSPKWLQDRLRAVGLRPISALVDITNYFTMDMARPLHVFDADKLSGDVVVRLGRAGEEIDALDGRRYTADSTMTLICDEEKANAFGGIIGGEATGCTGETVNVFLESALFDPVRTAATGRKLGVLSDARYRFERGVDPTSAVAGMEAATRMILELCGGEASRPAVAGQEPEWRRHYRFRTERTESLGGVAVPAARSVEILQALSFKVESGGGGALTAAPPPWRPDILGEADLVEEVLRVHGFEHIPAADFPAPEVLPAPALTRGAARAAKLRRALAAHGMAEAVTFSFMPARWAALFGGGDAALRLDNPISSDLDCMRPSVLPNLLDAARRNADGGRMAGALFEVGPVFLPGAAAIEPDGQRQVAGGVRWGATPRHWSAPARPVDALDAKADALAALAALAAPLDKLRVTADAPAWFHPGRSGALRLGAVALAHFGELHPRVLEAFDAAAPIAVFEAFPDAAPVPKARAGGKLRPALRRSAFQPVERDFAFVVAEGVAAESVLRAVRNADKALIADAAVFDVYRGKGVEPGSKSLAIAVTLQPQQATLTDADLEAASARIVTAVAKATGGALRG